MQTAFAQVGLRDFVSREPAPEIMDQLCFVRRHFAQITPGCAQLLRQSCIFETMDLSGMERGEVGARNFSRRDLFQQQ